MKVIFDIAEKLCGGIKNPVTGVAASGVIIVTGLAVAHNLSKPPKGYNDKK